MNRKFRFSWILKATTICLLASAPLAAKAAEPQDNVSSHFVPGAQASLVTDINDPNQAMSQVTSVSQLSDVQPTDWAFQALQSLVERYGCIAGYPNGTFRGNRAATRYELAAALNACLDQISDRFATKEDLETVKALQEEFKTEMATVRGQVDGLEARTATLEAQQFSTTSKLNGEIIFAGAEVFTENDRRLASTGTSNASLNSRFFSAYRARLNFDTSFTGKDRLRVRLQGSNVANVSTASGSNQGRLGFDGIVGTNQSGTVELDDLWYRFPIGKKITATVIAKSGEFNDFVGDTFNPYLSSSGTGSLSRFGRFNPIYRFGTSSFAAGLVVNYKLNDRIAASVGYLADNPTQSVGPVGGLFGASYAALAQLEVKPFKNVGVGLTYVHSFQEVNGPAGISANLSNSTGSSKAGRPFGNNPNSSDSAGFEFNWKTTDWLNLSGWAGVTFADAANSNLNGTVINWAIAAAFPDLLMPGSVGAIIFGQEPKQIGGNSDTNCNTTPNGADCGNNYHVTAQYKFNVNGNISVTPGVIVIFNGENNDSNPTEFIPVVRTTFTF